MIEAKRLACVSPHALPVLKLWVDDEALDLAEELACAHDTGKLTPIEHADIIACATDSDVRLAPTLQHAPPAWEHPAVPPGLGLERYCAHVDKGSIPIESADISHDLDIPLSEPEPYALLLSRIDIRKLRTLCSAFI